MNSLTDIRKAIESLAPREKALLSAELFAMEEPDDSRLAAALQRGLDDIQSGRVHTAEQVRAAITQWTARS